MHPLLQPHSVVRPPDVDPHEHGLDFLPGDLPQVLDPDLALLELELQVSEEVHGGRVHGLDEGELLEKVIPVLVEGGEVQGEASNHEILVLLA